MSHSSKSSNHIFSGIYFFHSFSILEGCWDLEPNRRPSFELLHETLLNILQRSNCSQLFDVAATLDDDSFSKLRGKPASSPTNESSDSAICEVERLSVSPVSSCTSVKQSASTDLDSRIKTTKPIKPVVSACNVVFIEGDPMPEMNPDGSTEI